MTTTAAEGFTIQSQGGSNLSWSGLANTLYGSSGTASSGPGTLWQSPAATVYYSVPNYITDLLYGSEFTSLSVSFTLYSSDATTRDVDVSLTGGSTKSDTFNNSETVLTFSGNATYWGLSASSHDIFTGLKDGSIKFIITPDAGGPGVYYYLKSVTSTLTYKEADTARAAILTVIP